MNVAFSVLIVARPMIAGAEQTFLWVVGIPKGGIVQPISSTYYLP
jgi:hypothetical protein